MNFVINHIDPESLEFILDGETISYANHDEDGWIGMEKLSDMFSTLAKKNGCEVKHIED